MSGHPEPGREAPVLLIGGSPRSGTGLVRRIVGSHPDVVLPPFEIGMHRRVDRGERPAAVADELAAELTARVGPVERADLDHSSHGALFRSTLRAMAAATERPIAGDKTPGIETALATYRRWLPDRRILLIQIMRHPADAVSSHLRAPWYADGEGPSAVKRVAAEWCDCATVALDGTEDVDIHTVVRFEELTREPRRVTEVLCSALGLRREPATIDRMLAGSAYPRHVNSSFDEVGERVAGTVHRGLERRNHLTVPQRHIVAEVCGPLAERLGYRLRP